MGITKSYKMQGQFWESVLNARLAAVCIQIKLKDIQVKFTGDRRERLIHDSRESWEIISMHPRRR